jgi:hypothetical protein
MMAAQQKAKPPGANQYVDRVADKPEAPITLAEAGIDNNLAHRARTFAPSMLAGRLRTRFRRPAGQSRPRSPAGLLRVLRKQPIGYLAPAIFRTGRNRSSTP